MSDDVAPGRTVHIGLRRDATHLATLLRVSRLLHDVGPLHRDGDCYAEWGESLNDHDQIEGYHPEPDEVPGDRPGYCWEHLWVNVPNDNPVASRLRSEHIEFVTTDALDWSRSVRNSASNRDIEREHAAVLHGRVSGSRKSRRRT